MLPVMTVEVKVRLQCYFRVQYCFCACRASLGLHVGFSGRRPLRAPGPQIHPWNAEAVAGTRTVAEDEENEVGIGSF